LEQVLAWYVSGLVTIRDLRFHIQLADILSRECDLYWSRRPPFRAYPLQNLRVVVTAYVYVPQAAKDVRASQNTVLDILERIEMFFRRLDVYTEVEPTPEMMDMMVQITVEVLSILGIATKEIKQGRTSE
jgi:hypothetical protein